MRDQRRVYVGRLSLHSKERDIIDRFSAFGRVITCDLKNGFAFVEYDDPKNASAAVSSMDGREFDGSVILCEFARGTVRGSRGKGGPPERSSYRAAVSNLPPDMSWQDLKDHFRQAAEVIYAQVWPGRRSATGVVEFRTREGLRRAIHTLDNTELRGGPVYVREDDSRPRSRSPRRRRSPSYSPRRRRRSPSYSPRRRSRSPRRYSRSASRDRSRSPRSKYQRRSISPRSGSPRNESPSRRSNPRDTSRSRSPARRRSGSADRRSPSPSRRSNPRDSSRSRSPARRHSGSADRRSPSPSRRSGSSERRSPSSGRDSGSPRRSPSPERGLSHSPRSNGSVSPDRKRRREEDDLGQPDSKRPRVEEEQD